MLLCVFAIALNSYHIFFPPQSIRTIDFFGLGRVALIDNVYLKIILSTLLIIIEAYLLNRLVNKHRLNRTLSYLCAASYVLLVSYSLSEILFHEILVANLFAILSLRSLYSVYKKHLPIASLFNAGAFMGIAAILYSPYLIFVIALFLGLFSLRSFNLKEILQISTGFLAPYFFSFIGLSYFGRSKLALTDFIGKIGFPLDLHNLSLESGIPFYVILVLIILILIYKSENCKKKKFDAIKKIEISYWILFLSIPALFFVHEISRADFILISIPLAINLGFILEMKSNKLIKEFLFLVFVGIYIADLFLF